MKKVLFLILFLIFITVMPVSAQIFLERGKITYQPDPDTRVSDSILVHNTSDRPLELRIYLEDFQYQPPYDGTKKFLPAGTTDYSLNEWINFSPRKISLEPYAKKNISVVFDVPANVDKGHYGVLFFENQTDKIQSEKGMNIVTRVGSLLFVEPKEVSKNLLINNFVVSKNIFKGEFHNQGKVIIIPSTVYYVMNESGIVSARGDLPNVYLPPQASATFSVPLEDFDVGQYTFILTFDLENGDVMVKEVDIVKSATGSIDILTIRD